MNLTFMGRMLLFSVAFTLLFTFPVQAEETTSLTADEATKQAQGQINKPPTVYDLTNPGIVYSKLGEGVNAWRATLKGSANEWGVDTSPVAVQGSTRPDVVPASLQAFLLQYYKDHPQVGLAFGPAGVESAVEQLQNDYNTAVSQLAHNLMTNSIANANNNSANNENNSNTNSNDNNSNANTNDNQNNNENPSNNSENVPPLDNNDNGNSNNNDTPVAKKIHVIYFSADG